MKIYTFDSKVLTHDSKWLKEAAIVLPARTVRAKWKSGYTPTVGLTNTLVDAGNNIWDSTISTSSWQQKFTSTAIKNNLLEIIAANTKDVTNVKQCFSNCSNLTSVCSLDLTGLTTMSTQAMFQGCSALATVGNITTSAITSANKMFHGCTALTRAPLFNTASVTDMSGMFYGCTSLTFVPLYDTSSLTTVTDVNGTGMFRGCTSLVTVPNINTGSVANMSGMFYGCTSLTSIPFLDTSSATNMSRFCQGCTSLKTIPLFDTTRVMNVNYMFMNCTNVESGALALYTQLSTQTYPPDSYTDTFTECGSNTVTGAAELAQIPTSWGGTAS